MERGSFSIGEELRADIDQLLRESDAMAIQALSLILEELRRVARGE